MKKCLTGNRPVLKNGEAKIYKDNLELVLQRHIHNLHNSSVNGMQTVINSAYIIENTLLKIREILETHSPETNGYYGWLMLRLPSQLKHIEEFLEFSNKVAWSEFHENEITEMYVKNVLAGKKFATKDLPIEVNTQMARLLIDKQLKEKGAMLVRKDGELKLVQSALPEMDFYMDNKPVSFSDFTNKILAENKMLEVSQPATTQATQQTIQTGNQNTAKFEAQMAQSMAAVTN